MRFGDRKNRSVFKRTVPLCGMCGSRWWRRNKTLYGERTLAGCRCEVEEIVRVIYMYSVVRFYMLIVMVVHGDHVCFPGTGNLLYSVCFS